ncbi:MAG: hemerythrin domain-containing protein [Hyphomicrobiales bacterium]|nr:hemerythrin domain-containing protein [Hyphomicrobiales bacterium]
MPLAIDMIRSEHRTMAKLLDLLERQIDLFEKTGEPDYDLLGEIVDYFRSFPDLYHHPKEDLIFAYLSKRAPDAVAEFGDLEAEHEKVNARLNRFARAVVNVLMQVEVPREAFVRLAREFILGERKHMQAEETLFFPLALEKLDEADWAEIDARIARFKDPLLETQAPHRYAALQEQLTHWRGEPAPAARPQEATGG